MHIYRTIESLPFFENTVATVGMFDGIHLGHQAMICQLIETARLKEARPLVITFDPHPLMILSGGEKKIALLTTTSEKLVRFKMLRIEHVLLLPFSKLMAALTAEKFIYDILIQKTGLTRLLIGFNHTLGHDRGTLKTIQKLGEKHQFECITVPPVDIDNVTVSSTRIREALLQGDIEHANLWLGRQYSIFGRVIRGMQIGRELGFPTANLEVPREKLIPKDGVYAVLVTFENHQYTGLVNIGNSPTIAGKTWGIEIYIDNFKEIIYNKSLEMNFVGRIRDEMKFDSIDALKKQINNDHKNAQQMLAPYIRR